MVGQEVRFEETPGGRGSAYESRTPFGVNFRIADDLRGITNVRRVEISSRFVVVSGYAVQKAHFSAHESLS